MQMQRSLPVMFVLHTMWQSPYFIFHGICLCTHHFNANGMLLKWENSEMAIAFNFTMKTPIFVLHATKQLSFISYIFYALTLTFLAHWSQRSSDTEQSHILCPKCGTEPFKTSFRWSRRNLVVFTKSKCFSNVLPFQFLLIHQERSWHSSRGKCLVYT